jgi:hypothetical protein
MWASQLVARRSHEKSSFLLETDALFAYKKVHQHLQPTPTP